jgi:hypothetical protein
MDLTQHFRDLEVLTYHGEPLMPSQTPGRLRKILVRVMALVLVFLNCGALYDLYYPRTTQMREFDPDEVARLETAMWRSYYEKRQHALAIWQKL